MGTTWSSAVAIGVALLCASGEASASAPPHELASDRPLTGLIASGDTLFYGVNSGYFFATEGAAPRKLASTSVEWGSAMSLGNGRMLANNAFTGALLSSDGTASGTSVITTAVRGEVLAPDPVFGTPPPEYRAFTVMDGVALFAAHLPDAPPGAYSAWRSAAVNLFPAVRRVLVHMAKCGGGWTDSDPIRVRKATLVSMAKLGLITIEWWPDKVAGPEAVAAKLTTDGWQEATGFVLIKGGKAS